MTVLAGMKMFSRDTRALRSGCQNVEIMASKKLKLPEELGCEENGDDFRQPEDLALVRCHMLL